MQSKPKIFVAENVKGMMTLGKGEVFKQIVGKSPIQYKNRAL